MMRKAKQWVTWILAAVLLVSAIGCGKTDSSATNTETVDVAETEAASERAETGADALAIRGNTAPTEEEISLVNTTLEDSYLTNPYADVFEMGSDYSAYDGRFEGVTLTVWMPFDGSELAILYPDMNDNPIYQMIEELTGINIEFITPTMGEESTEFNLMISSGTLPDIIYGGDYYTGGVKAGVEDGAFIDLTDLVEEYMPNYMTVRNSNATYAKDTAQDDGSIYYLTGIQPYPGLDWYILMIKQEALDKTGMDVPETMDEWHDFLTACKEAGYSMPLIMDDFYGTYFTSVFSAPYGVYDWTFLDDDGNIAFGPTQEGTKEYLQTMNDWYNEGLINADLVTGTREEHVSYMVSDDSAAALLWMDYYDDAGIEYVVAPNPVLNKGDTPVCTSGVGYNTGSPTVITSACENVEAALALLDFGYTMKGWEIYNFGSYGDTHLVDEEGVPYYPENSLMYNDPDDQPLNYLKYKYRIANSFAYIRDDEHSNPATTSTGHVLNNRIYLTETHDHSHSVPSLELTAEESERASAILTDLSTLRTEYMTKIVMGQLPVDSWDECVANMEDMGLSEYLDIYQAALDRYNARS